VSSECAIDFQAGPSEILIVSERGNPEWIAADLLAQAEHDPDARAILVTSRTQLALAVAREVMRQMPADGPAPAAIAANGGIIVTASAEKRWRSRTAWHPSTSSWTTSGRRRASTARAPSSSGARRRRSRATTRSVEPRAADGCRGPLPRRPDRGRLRARRLGAAADEARARALAPAVTTLARAEGLVGHARSIDVRLAR
jgi:histidinol dehydrogenase